MADQALKARFFVTRQNDRMVPLVALDELPDHIVIRGVPRNLTPRDIQGMTCIGAYDTRHQKHTVVNMNQSPATPLGEQGLSSLFQGNLEPMDLINFKSAPVSVIGDTPGIRADVQTTTPPDNSGQIPISPESLPTSVGTNDPFSAASSASSPASSLPPAGVKTYCSYWLRTGNCDFAQQGCMYKHEMPTDLETLNRLGHRDIPSWYRQKFGIGSFLAVDGADASFNKPDLRSVIASGSRSRNDRLSSNWRSPSVGDTSDSGLDARPHTGNFRAARFGRTSGQGSPLNPARPSHNKRTPRPNSSTKTHQETAAATGPRTHNVNSTRRLPHRRVSLVSVASDFEAEVFRQDTTRKAKEEADRTAMDSSSSQGIGTQQPEERLPGKISNLGTTGSVSGAANRRRGGRGHSRKGRGREESAGKQKE